MPLPPREVPIDVDLVRKLVRGQAPPYLHLEPVFAEEGWDNVVFRMGDTLAARIPRRQIGADLLRAEQDWLDQAAAHLEVDVPRHVFKGQPTDFYPWGWSIVAWVEGHAADIEPLRPDQAGPLARQLRLLHRPAPKDAPFNPFRSTSLLARADEMFGRLDKLGLPGL
ncbi:MAG: phosphotransferase, partial [Rhodothermales bacterium]|nr:phosphotransferase [Rhodothermales bacterium]